VPSEPPAAEARAAERTGKLVVLGASAAVAGSVEVRNCSGETP